MDEEEAMRRMGLTMVRSETPGGFEFSLVADGHSIATAFFSHSELISAPAEKQFFYLADLLQNG
jgi:hypothetical protein